MNHPLPADVNRLISERMKSGGYHSEEDVLREALRALAEQESDLFAIREAIVEWRNGDEGVPPDEAFDKLRERYPA